jgi:hypothetical protein
MAVVDTSAPTMDTDDRFGLPLYSVPEAAGYLGVPTSTFATWAYGYVRKPPGRSEVRGDPLVAAIRAETVGAAAIPFRGVGRGHDARADPAGRRRPPADPAGARPAA